MRYRQFIAAVAALPAFGGAAWAQAIPQSVRPGAIERSLEQRLPDIKNDQIEVPVPQGFAAPSGSDAVRFTLRGVDVHGDTAIAPDVLVATYASFIGHEVSLADMFTIARAITDTYAKAGYALSFALVPQQRIDKGTGTVRIDIVEGYVSEIAYQGDADGPSPALRQYGDRITQARPLTTAALERFLLLMNDLPGVTARSVFARLDNAPAGATRLVVTLQHAAVTAALGVNNRGSRALGPWRADAQIAFNTLLHQGEAVELRAVRALNGKELSYGAAEFLLPLGDDGLKLTANVSYSDAHPGTALLSSVAFASSGWTSSAALNYPLLRSRASSVWLWGGVEAKWLRSAIMATPNSRDTIYGLQAGATYSGHDGSGATGIDMVVSQGVGIFGATTSASPLRSRAAGSGIYTVATLDATRLQNLWGPIDLFVSLQGQVASRGLLSSEQCGYGGASFGRGFDDNDIVGDHCAMASAELRWTPSLAMSFFKDWPFQLFANYDAGAVWNDGPLGSGEYASASGTSIGAGLRTTLFGKFSGTVECDKPLGRDVTLEGNRHARIFAQLGFNY